MNMQTDGTNLGAGAARGINESAAGPVIEYERYPNAKTTSGVKIREPWTTFVERLDHPRIVPVENDWLADKKKLDDIKTVLPLLRFVGGGGNAPSRSKDKPTPITEVNTLVFDCDDDHDEIEIHGKLARYLHCGYTTFKHTFEGQERLRVVVPLSQPVTPERYGDLWDTVAEHLGGMTDTTAREFHRGFFAPGVPAPLKDKYSCWHQPGELLNPEDWPARAKSTSSADGIQGKPAPKVAEIQGNLDGNDFEHKASRPKILAALACVFADKRSMWFPVACALKRTGWADAFDLFLGWSQSTRKNNYNEAVARKTWDSITDNREKTIQAGRIIFEARRNGFDDLSVDPKHPAAVYWRELHEGKTPERAGQAAHTFNSTLDGGPLSAATLQDAFARIDAWRAEVSTQDPDWMVQPLLPDCYEFDSEAAAVAYLNQRIAYHARNNLIIDRALADNDGDPFAYVRVHDAKDAFANIRVIIPGEKKPIVMPAFDVWMKSPARREYRNLRFDASGAPLPPRTLNLWGGFGIEAKQGRCSLIRKHMLYVICGGNQEQYEYLYSLLAWKIQHPHLPTEVALVLRTEAEGSGKDTLFVILRIIFGPHFRVAANADHLFKWNAGLLSNAAIVSIGEMLWSGNHAHAGRFKEMITGKMVGTEAKYAHPGSTVNTTMYLISSNEDWVVPAGRDARRYFVPDMSSSRVGDKAYFDALYAEIRGDGPAALLHELLAHDLGNWHPREGIPQTRALKEQKLQSLEPVPRWWQDCLDAGEVSYTPVGHQLSQDVIKASDWATGPVIANKTEMRDVFLHWARQQRVVGKKGITVDDFFNQLRRYAPGNSKRAPGTGARTGPGTGALFSDHAACVAQFEAALTRK